MGALRFLVAGDQEIERKALCAVVREEHGWEVVAEARDGREAVELTKQLRPEVAILNMGIPLLNGLDAARQIAKSDSKTKVLLLTIDRTDQLAGQTLDRDVRGCLLTSDTACDLVSAVKALHHGKTFLTQREEEVTRLVAEGHSSKGIRYCARN